MMIKIEVKATVYAEGEAKSSARREAWIGPDDLAILEDEELAVVEGSVNRAIELFAR